MKNTKELERRCSICKRIIVDTSNKTGICPKCTKKAITTVTATATATSVVLLSIKKHSKTISQVIKNLIFKK